MRCAAIFLIFAAAQVDAQARTQTKVCEALSVRMAQSPAALEGRILNEWLVDSAALDCPDIARDLLDAGASVVARNRFGGTALNVAAARGAREIVALLVDRGAELDHPNLAGTTPLLAAVEAGRRRMVGELIALGADVNASNREGITPLMAAAFEGDPRSVAILLEAGANPEVEDRYGKGALVYAAGRGFPGIVATLLEGGAEAGRIWGNDLTALMWAAGHANDAPAQDGIAVAEALLEAGVLLNAQDDRGRTALMIAAERGHGEMVSFLLARGADPELADKNGLIASDLAATPEIAARLPD